MTPGLPANDPAPLGGDTYITADGDVRSTPLDRIGICSFGFNSVDANGDAVNVTAGHCDAVARADGGSSVYLPNRENIDESTRIGAFTSSSVGTDSHSTTASSNSTRPVWTPGWTGRWCGGAATARP